MPYESMKDVPASLKGIDPPITLAQANSIARCADAIDPDTVESPWAVCIASFKKSHKVNGAGTGWVKKEKKKSMEITQIDAVEVDGELVTLLDLVAAHKAMSREEPVEKSFDLMERCHQVDDAWHEQFAKPALPGGERPWYNVHVEDDMVTVKLSDGLYAYSYTVAEDGKVTFGEPVKGRMVFQPDVEKAITDTNVLKAISKTDEELRVANYLALFNARDLEGIGSRRVNEDGSTGEYFTPETKFDSSYTATGRLLIDWDHGLDRGDGDDIKAPGRDDILGYVDWGTAKADSRGLWVERVLDRRNAYMQFLEELIEADMIGTSSESIPGKAVRAGDGQILEWPLRRDTMTVTPMDWRMMGENALAAAKSLAEMVPEFKAMLPGEVFEEVENIEAIKMTAQIEIDLLEMELA